VVGKVIIPMILSPTVGLLGGYLLMVIALWVFCRANPHRVDPRVPYCTDLLRDQPGARPWPARCTKSMGIIVLALVTAGHQQDCGAPLWVVLACALASCPGVVGGISCPGSSRSGP
jgi:inorganic phosphate transporter, PiT family